VLVVDDEDGVRTVTGVLLESLGFKVVQAADGFQALTAFANHEGRFRLVLLDLTMPQLSGAETFRELRKARSDVQVILMSGYSEQDAREGLGDGGLAGFLRKPFGLDDLVTALQAALPAD
jgi:CheY-like chemotaxis protein